MNQFYLYILSIEQIKKKIIMMFSVTIVGQ